VQQQATYALNFNGLDGVVNLFTAWPNLKKEQNDWESKTKHLPNVSG
jgi:hypothetical protein